MQVILVRGTSGACAWTKILTGARAWNWVCTRDMFSVAGPSEAVVAEAAAAAIILHSSTLVGAVTYMVQLDL